LVATHLRSRVRGICRVLRGVRRYCSLFVGFRFLAWFGLGGLRLGRAGSWVTPFSLSKLSELSSEWMLPTLSRCRLWAFETLSVLRWHSWTVGAHGLLGRKGGYGAAWADFNQLYGKGEPEMIFLGRAMEYHTYDSRLNVSDLIRWFITCFDDSDEDALSTHAGMGDMSAHLTWEWRNKSRYIAAIR
jgi:hypothetical protein